jgi:tripartite-type tricarboxylate transporter receptor subunit TctC
MPREPPEEIAMPIPRRALAALPLALAAPRSAAAQDRAIRLIVPAPPGPRTSWRG